MQDMPFESCINKFTLEKIYDKSMVIKLAIHVPIPISFNTKKINVKKTKCCEESVSIKLSDHQKNA